MGNALSSVFQAKPETACKPVGNLLLVFHGLSAFEQPMRDEPRLTFSANQAEPITVLNLCTITVQSLYDRGRFCTDLYCFSVPTYTVENLLFHSVFNNMSGYMAINN